MAASSMPAAAQSSFYGAGKADIPETAAPVDAPDAFTDPTLICQDLRHCIGITERHAPNSFDYAALAADFARFGVDGERALMTQLGGDDPGLAARALTVLSESRAFLSPAGQAAIAGLWAEAGSGQIPIDVRALERVLTRHVSPMVRAAAIDTLGSPDAQIQAASRRLLLAFSRAPRPRGSVNTALSPQQIARVKAALRAGPHPGLVAVLAMDSRPLTSPILADSLLSGDAPTTIAAYAALYDRSAEDAFRALVSTLYGLPDDADTVALALSQLLQVRHKNRADGFYMRFARDLVNDKKMSLMGRMAGLDALIMNGTKPLDLPDNDAIRQSFARGLSAYKGRIPDAYFQAVPDLVGNDATPWLRMMASNIADDDLLGLRQLATLSGEYNNPLAVKIARDAMAARRDYRRVIAGIYARTLQMDGADTDARVGLAKQIAGFADHPIDAVGQAARRSVRALGTKTPRATLDKTRKATRSKPLPQNCRVDGDDFAALARPMPYFDGATLRSGQPALRGFLTTAARMRGGWIAGYSTPTGDGALLAYDVDTGAARALLPDTAPAAHHAVQAIIPFNSADAGQSATGYWVVTDTETDAAIYRALYTGRGLDVSLYATLPARPTQLTASEGGAAILAFAGHQAPLSVSLQSGLMRACASAGQTHQDILP